MGKLKNTFVGFLVSFAGSIPLGYLNIAGYEIFSYKGWQALLPYILGVILVEAFVIYVTLVFADKLSSKKNLIRGIEIFSILFMLTLAILFFIKTGNPEQDVFFRKYFDHSPFVIGLILNGTNFMQLPFWVAWNLYVVNHNYVTTFGNRKIFYLMGTLMGSFAGITVISVGLDYAGKNSNFLSHYMGYLFPLVFLLLAIYQSVMYYRKYHR
jgi:hypothetical protein